LDKGIKGSINKLKAFGAAVGGSVVIGRLKEFTTEVINTGDEIDKTSQALGMSTDSLQAWRHAANLSGIAAEEFTVASKTLQKNAFEAGVNKSQGFVNAFKQIDVKVTDSKGKLKGFDQLFLETGLGLSGLTNKTEKTAIAMTLFGEAGTKMFPLFDQGAEAISAARAEVKKFGGGLSRDAVANAAKAQDALARFDIAVLSLKGKFAEVFLPTLEKVIDKFGKFVSKALEMTKGTDIVKSSLIVATAVVAAFGKALILAFIKALPVVAGFVLAIVIVDEVIGTLTGKDTVIRDLLDAWLGAGETARLVENLSDAITKLFDKDYAGASHNVANVFDTIGKGIVEGAIRPLHEMEVEYSIAIEKWVAGVAQGTLNWLSQVKKVYAALASEIIDDVTQLGEDMISGLIKGINAGVDQVKDAFSSVLKAAIDAGSGAIQAKSPSRLTFKQGQFLDRGAEMGIKSESDRVVRAAKNMWTRTTNVMGARVNTVNHINQHITGNDPTSIASKASVGVGGATKQSYDAALQALVTVG
jgi:hypothetical protein